MKVKLCALGAAIVSAMFAALPAHAAFNDDVNECQYMHSQQGIDACTRLLAEIPWTQARQPAWVYFDRGSDYYSVLGQNAQALSDLNEAIREAPAYAAAFNNRALVYMDTGELQLAKADLDTVIALHPDYMQSNGGNSQSIIYSVTPTDIARMNRARVEVQLGDLAGAVADADTAKKRAPVNPPALAIDCWVHAMKGDQLDQALADCNAAAEAAPKDAWYLMQRGFVRFRMNDFADAVKDLDAALAIEPRDAEALYMRGLAKAKSGDVAGGNADMEAAMAIDSKTRAFLAHYGIES